jgi:hypothetical protein
MLSTRRSSDTSVGVVPAGKGLNSRAQCQVEKRESIEVTSIEIHDLDLSARVLTDGDNGSTDIAFHALTLRNSSSTRWLARGGH